MNRSWSRAAIVALGLALTLSLHYMILPVPHVIHLMHRRLCYVPIILAALWFGLRGGLLAAAVISFAVLPLALKVSGPLLANEEVVEIFFYFSLAGLAGALVDSAERERKRRELLQRELAENERLAALGRAAAGIAHEVRTPLGSIQGAAEILGEDYAADHPRRAYYDILLEECRRMGRVVNDFLALGRPLSLQLRRGPLFPLLEEAMESVRSEAQAKGVRLLLCPGTPPFALEVDRDRLRQALENLLRNAVAASPADGEVSVSCAREADRLLIRVRDRGQGVAAEEREKIFEPFFTRRKDGTGMGLAVARQVARAHGGELAYEPAEGGGACFRIELPGGGEG